MGNRDRQREETEETQETQEATVADVTLNRTREVLLLHQERSPAAP